MIQVIGDNCPVLLRHTFLNEKRADYKRNRYCGGRDNERNEHSGGIVKIKRKGEKCQKIEKGANKNGEIVQGGLHKVMWGRGMLFKLKPTSPTLYHC